MKRRRTRIRLRWLVAVLAILVVAAALDRLATTRQSAVPASSGLAVASVNPERAHVVQGDWYVLGFTAPQYPDRHELHQGGLDVLLVDLIGRAQRTVDVAIYDFDLANVARALADAQRRGVRVRLVAESDTLADTKNEHVQRAFAIVRDAGIPIVADERPPFMHHKYTVVDGEWVATGSWNYTDADTYRANNWLGIFRSPELAQNYTANFEELFVRRNFAGAGRLRLPHPRITIGEATVTTCFSPDGGCTDQIVRTIEARATRSIQFMAFSFTSDPIGRALLAKARAGVHVEGVFETTGVSTPASEYRRLKEAGLDVLTDGNPYNMHHKVIILDDQVTIAGSFNFSANAESDNDENLLIIDDAAIARAFHAEYDRVRAVALNPPKN